MWNWIKSVGSGIGNILSGKSWNGDDPAKIKQEAEDALKNQQRQYDEILNKYNSSLKTASESASSSKKLVYVLGAVCVAGGIYMLMSKKGGRRW